MTHYYSAIGLSSEGERSGAIQNNVTNGNTGDSWNSLEQFLTPIQIQKTHPAAAPVPGMRAASVKDEKGTFGGHWSDLSDDGAVGPTVHDLDPYFPQVGGNGGDDGGDWFSKNDFISVYSDAKGADGSPELNLDNYVELADGDKKDISVVQVNALRGPLIMSGWGFGSDDMPQPSRGLGWPDNSYFDDDTPTDRWKWKTGPVHLMWDDERQVWHGGPRVVYGVVVGEVKKGDICNPSTFKVRIFRNAKVPAKGFDVNVTGSAMSDISGEEITVHNRDVSLEQDTVANQIFCVAMKINYEWIPIWVGCPETPACGEEVPVPACVETQCPE